MSDDILDPDERALRAEVERRLGRPFDEVQEQLEDLFGKEWEEVEVHVATAADKRDRTEADVIVDLVAKAEYRPPFTEQVRRSVIRWIGKPWRDRENPWDKYKGRIPPARSGRDLREPPPTSGEGEEWRPIRPEE